MDNVSTTGDNVSTTGWSEWRFVGEFPYCEECGQYMPDSHQHMSRKQQEENFERLSAWINERLNAAGIPQGDPLLAVVGAKDGDTPEEVRSAYRQKLKEVHPDMAGGSTEETRAVIAAYAELKRRGLAA